MTDVVIFDYIARRIGKCLRLFIRIKTGLEIVLKRKFFITLFLFLCLIFAQISFADDIHVAVQRGSIDEVRAMLKANPRLVGSPDENGNLPLHLAADAGNLEIVDLLLTSGADVHAEGQYRRTALSNAMMGRHYEVVKRLIKAGAIEQPEEAQSKFSWAVRFDAELTRIFVAAGVDVNGRNYIDETPLHSAVSGKRPDCIEVLIKAGADVNALDQYEFTPLLRLVKYDPDKEDVPAIIEITRLLLRAGADPGVTDEDNWNIAHFSAWFNVPDLVEVLVEEGVDVSAPDRSGHTPLDLARKQRAQRVIKILEAATKSES